MSYHDDEEILETALDSDVIRTNNAIYSIKLEEDEILNHAIAEWEHGITRVFPLIEVICFAGEPTGATRNGRMCLIGIALVDVFTTRRIVPFASMIVWCDFFRGVS